MESAKKLVINIVTWNSARYLPSLFDSLDRQTSQEFTVTVVDNASTDGTVEWLTSERPDVALLRNFRNQGFSRGHNQAIALARSRWEDRDLEQRYVMVANPDVEFHPECVGEAIAFLDAHPEVAVVAPKLLRAITRGQGDDGRPEIERTNVIDAAGIAITRARRVIDRGAGEEDNGQYDSDTRVFGASGACVVYRMSALAAARIGDEYFDEDMFAYQEDVDLAWRLRLLGQEARLVPSAIAWHHRRSPSIPKGGWLASWKLRRAKSPHINFYSTRNHGWVMLKNEQGSNLFFHLPWWLPYELAKGIAGLFSLNQLKAQRDSLGGIPAMLRKRKEIQKRATVAPADLRKWFV